MIERIRQRTAAKLCLSAAILFLAARVSAQKVTQQPPVLQINNQTASAVAWNPEGTVLAVGDSTGVLLYTEDLKLIRFFEQPSEQMKALAWSPDGKYIAAVGANDVLPVDIKAGDLEKNDIYIWEVQTGELVTVFDKHRFLIPALAWSPDGTHIASGSWDNTVQIWDPLTGDVTQVFSTLSEGKFAHEVMSISWSPDGNHLAAVALGAGVFIWDANMGDVVSFIPWRHPYPPHPVVVAWSRSGKVLATGYGVLDVTSKVEANFENCPPSYSIDWSPDSRMLALHTGTGVYICDVMTDEVLAILESGMSDSETKLGYYPYAVDWHPDGERLAGAAGDGFIRIWRLFGD